MTASSTLCGRLGLAADGTFQVSDIQLTARRMRLPVFAHVLAAFALDIGVSTITISLVFVAIQHSVT